MVLNHHELCRGWTTSSFPDSNCRTGMIQFTSSTRLSSSSSSSGNEVIDNVQKGFQRSLRIIQESQRNGDGFKQIVANVLAGEYDSQEVGAQIDQIIASAPCVMFTWERSPSCVKAIEAMDLMKIRDDIQVFRLDDPWEKGNPIRAEIGKRVGRSSVPMIFIGGEYVGGYDGGVSDEAPGIIAMSFQGTLRPRLEAAGLKLPS